MKKLKFNWLILTLTSTVLMSAGALFADEGHDHGKSGSGTAQMNESMQKMHGKMMEQSKSGDPDVDFAKMMLTHHQGAIEMARTELKNGDDPEMKKMAEKAIKDQEKDIQKLRAWLKKKGVDES